MKKKIQNKLGTYLAVTAGVGCASSAANAAVVFYGNAGNIHLQADPAGILIHSRLKNDGYVSYTNRYVSRGVDAGGAIFGLEFFNSRFFTRGVDLNSTGGSTNVKYVLQDVFGLGAVAGTDNYANISFNGDDDVYEAVAQFFFDGAGGGYLMAIATTNPIPNPQNLSGVGGPALSISAGKAMIDTAAAVPEPSSLVLLALGATGLAARRQRRKAA